MTDEQIMQGLKWCYQVEGSCGDCPYRPDDIKKAKCHDRLGNDVIGLIERQRAEIEASKELLKVIGVELENVKNLIVQNNKSKLKIYDAYEQKLKTARAEAIKEFAEKLKDEINQAIYTYYNHAAGGYYLAENCIDEIDNLVKEMVGADNA